jgi:phage terminase large subunit GpA-like protein
MHAEVRDHAGFRINSIKTTIINRLVRGQSIRFAGHLEDEYFAQLTSNAKSSVILAGSRLCALSARLARAEALDCLCYAFAARHGAQVQLQRRENDLRMTARPPKPVVREQEPSLWDQSERDWWGKRDIWAR